MTEEEIKIINNIRDEYYSLNQNLQETKKNEETLKNASKSKARFDITITSSDQRETFMRIYDPELNKVLIERILQYYSNNQNVLEQKIKLLKLNQ